MNVGGAAFAELRLTEELARRGHDVTLITGSLSPGEEETPLTSTRVKVLRIPRMRREVSPVSDAIALVELWRAIRRLKPDIVHTRLSKAGWLGRLSARAVGVPVVVHRNGGTLFHGYFGGAASRGIVWLERLASRWCDALLVDTPSIRREIVEYGVDEADRVFVLPPPLDLEKFRELAPYSGALRRELNLSGETPLVGIVARLVPVKGVDVFIDGAAALLTRHPGMRFVIVGDGECREALEEQCRAQGITSAVTFLGFRRDVREVLADIDVLVQTSRNEGTGIALVEAMAAGVPVAATAVGGCADLIRTGENGFLFPLGDGQGMARVVETLLADRALRSRLAAQGARDVRERFSPTAIAEATEALYGRLLDDRLRHPTSPKLPYGWVLSDR